MFNNKFKNNLKKSDLKYTTINIEKEIQSEVVEQSEVIRALSEMIFEKIYTNKKFKFNKKYDFGNEISKKTIYLQNNWIFFTK